MSMRPRGDEISRPHQFRLRRGSRLASLVASPAPAPAPWAEWFRVDIADDLDPVLDVSVVATAATGDGSLAPLLQLGPDVILIDKAMPDSLAAMRRGAVAAPGAKVVSLSVREGEDDRDVLASAEAGAIAYVPREASLEDLVAVIECAVRGEAVCSPRVAGALLRRIAALATDG